MLAETTLLTKVALLLACCMMIGAGGTYFGRNVRSLGAFIGLAILFIAGTIGVYFAAAVSPAVGVGVLFLWTFISHHLFSCTLHLLRGIRPALVVP